MAEANVKSPPKGAVIEDKSFDYSNGEVIADKVLGFYRRISRTAESEELAIALTSTFLMAVVNADAAKETNLRAFNEDQGVVQ
jgi:hypothetical protein|tara:strand:- start:303 stop:551 length:249 start_codon:yes stop_codon:yes gene_type:complete